MSPPTTAVTRYRLHDAELFRTLMKRTGTGAEVTLRALGELVGIPHTTIGNVLSGTQDTVSGPTAEAIATVIGVDLLILWVPDQRAAVVQTVPHELVAA
ncbi:helix-turn-helix transcriptional regulator [Streptomyces sp. NPDC048659]|uniref:helix-turn-helix domain-containing protein n=1 Tax=Streptomyces sp. NPDC048659 TaxID=3155489 RepID=UPI0034431D7E